MHQCDLTIQFLDSGQLTLKSMDDSELAVTILENDSDITVHAVSIEGPPGPTGPVGPAGPAGSKGVDGLFGEPAVPDLTLLFENALI